MQLADDPPAPATAWEAAQRLAAEGKHVHHVSEEESVCVSERCKPGPVR